MDDQTQTLITLFTNPWNLVLVACLWSGFQALKKAVPTFFDDDQPGNHLIRPLCVAAGAAAYFVPGPWIDADAEPSIKLVMGIIVGTVTTVAHGLLRDMMKLGKKAAAKRVASGDVEGAVKDATSLLELAKKLGPTLALIGAGGSGVYGAWLKPETGAQKAYEVHSAAIEELSGNIAAVEEAMKAKEADEAAFRSDLADKFGTHDKAAAIELALLRQRLAAVEDFARRWGGYQQPAASKSVSSDDLELSGDIEWQPRSAVEEYIGDKKNGKIQMPAKGEVFR